MTARGSGAIQLYRRSTTPTTSAPRFRVTSRQRAVINEVAGSLISDNVRHSFLLRISTILERSTRSTPTDNLVQKAINSALLQVLDAVPAPSAVRTYRYYQTDEKLPGAWKSVWRSWWSITEPNGVQRTLGPYDSFAAAWAAKLADEGGSP